MRLTFIHLFHTGIGSLILCDLLVICPAKYGRDKIETEKASLFSGLQSRQTFFFIYFISCAMKIVDSWKELYPVRLSVGGVVIFRHFLMLSLIPLWVSGDFYVVITSPLQHSQLSTLPPICLLFLATVFNNSLCSGGEILRAMKTFRSSSTWERYAQAPAYSPIMAGSNLRRLVTIRVFDGGRVLVPRF